MDDRTIRTALVVGAGVYLLSTLDDWFGPDDVPPPPPGGNVQPGVDDPRPATLTQAQATALADALFVAFWGDSLIVTPWEDDAAAAAALLQCRTGADVALLLNAYGYRGQVSNPMGLAATVAAYLDQDYRDEVNAAYHQRAIPFQW